MITTCLNMTTQRGSNNIFTSHNELVQVSPLLHMSELYLLQLKHVYSQGDSETSALEKISTTTCIYKTNIIAFLYK